MTDEKSFFSHKEYKSLLLWKIDSSPRQGRGVRAALAQAMKVQSAYLSRVLNGDADLSLEQADAANIFFGHGGEESRYFLLLVERARAGTSSLRAHFDREIRRILEERDRVKMERESQAQQILSLEDPLSYYSTWQYSAVHIALSIPRLQTKAALSQELKIPLEQVARILDFLLRTGMALEAAGRYQIGKTWIHLSPQSPLAARQHATWRFQAVPSIEKLSRDNFHYTQVVSLSQADSKRILEMLSQMIDRSNEIIRPSKEEDLRCLAVDFFSLV